MIEQQDQQPAEKVARVCMGVAQMGISNPQRICLSALALQTSVRQIKNHSLHHPTGETK
jgi:hypothetical protein